MKDLRTIMAILLMLLGACVAVSNWRCVIANMRNKRKDIDRYHSTIPLISLVTAGIAYISYPADPKYWIGLIPALDPVNWMLVGGLPIAIARGAFKGDRKDPGP